MFTISHCRVTRDISICRRDVHLNMIYECLLAQPWLCNWRYWRITRCQTVPVCTENKSVIKQTNTVGVSFSGRAIKHVKESIFSSAAGARRGVPKVLVVLTDGRSQDDVNKVSKEMQMDGKLFFLKPNLLSHKKSVNICTENIVV